MWIRTMNEQNCAGQICTTGTFCMRPALFAEPQHCVHADSVLNVAEALASGNTLVRCEEIVPLLTLVAQFLIFLVLLAHLCVFLCHRRRSAHVAMPSGAKSKLSCGNEGAEWGANADNCSAQTVIPENMKKLTISLSVLMSIGLICYILNIFFARVISPLVNLDAFTIEYFVFPISLALQSMAYGSSAPVLYFCK
uniref:Si:dkey-16m19.1 n=1 Tax=Globodera pallida TaxID=36090 RepID=A0A183C6V5_GLOPA